MAATGVRWENVPCDVPEFLVVWGVDKRVALMMDEAARSNTDRRKIALGFADAVV